MHIVLYQPEIPQNTGNIARLCAAARSQLHLIEPLGFFWDDQRLKRAGLDYWELVNIERHVNLQAYLDKYPGKTIYYATTKGGHSYTEVNFGRDFQEPEQFYDLSEAVAGLTCSNCKEGILETLQGIETGHIFQLGQVYSKPMNAKFINKEGREEHFWMGCYGIGVSRIVQTVAEQSYDDKGIVWPINIAPFQLHIQLDLAESLS